MGIMNAYLMHYGVKGMKWGVRRDPREIDRLDKEAFAIVIADSNNTMREASRNIRDARSGKIKTSARSIKDVINEGKELYNYAKKNRERFIGRVSKKDVERGKKILDELLSTDKNAAFNRTQDAFTRAELAEKHDAWSKNRGKAEKYLSKEEKYRVKGDHASRGSMRQHRYWDKSHQYHIKYLNLDSK